MAGEIKWATDYRFEFFPERIDRAVDTPDSPASLRCKGLADRVLEKSKGLIGPKGTGGTTGKSKEARNGRLADTGSVVNFGGAAWSVVYDHPIALIHHNGASGHQIPKDGAPNHTVTKEGSRMQGKKIVFLFNTKIPWGPRYHPVDHPGTDANPYLTDAADQIPELKPSGALMRGRTLTPIFRSKNFF